MICKNCGATFDDAAPKCPYCGQMNYSGAEEKYMNDLEQIHDNLEELADKPAEEYTKKSTGLLKRILLVLAVCFAIACIYFAVIQVRNANRAKERMNQLEWETENFAILDQWYDAGEYDKILEFEYQLFDTDSPYDIYTWTHYAFLGYYADYTYCTELSDMITNHREYDKYYLEEGLWSAMKLAYETTDSFLDGITTERSSHGGYQLSLQDRELADEYREYARNLLFDTLMFTEDEALQLFQSSLKDGFMSYKTITAYAGTVRERLDNYTMPKEY